MQAYRKTIVASLLSAAAVAVAGSASAQALGGGLRVNAPDTAIEPRSPAVERFGIRGSLGAAPYSYDGSGIRYDGSVRLGTGFLMADWYPYANGFRLSGGLAYANQRFAAAAWSGGARINSGTRSSAQLGSLDGRLALSKASPYLGFGWGLAPRAGSRLYFSADLGLMYQRPSAGLSGSCGAALPASVCSQLRSDVRGEEIEFREANDDVRLYPVISVGFGLRF